MKLNGIFYALCCAAAVMPGMTMAQQQDSTKVNKYFDAKDYLLQDRYIPRGRPIDNKAKGKNFTFGVHAGLTKMQGEAAGGPIMSDFSLFGMKDLSSFNSIRLTLAGGKNFEVGKIGLEADHIFRIQDYVGGWRPLGKFYVETVLGAGIYGVKPRNDKMDLAWGVHGGVVLNRRISHNMDFYIEPRLNVYSDNIDGRDIARSYDIGFQGLAGIRYRLTGYRYVPTINEDFMDNYFYEMYAGASGDFNKRVYDFMGMKTIGPTAGLSVGKWVFPLGIKGTFYGGWRYTPNDRRDDISEEPYLGLRIEGMLNLNTFVVSEITDPWLELNVTAGYQAGFIAHKGSGVYEKKIIPYHGPTVAFQTIYFVKPSLGVFAQFRWAEEKYDQEMVNGSIEKRLMNNLGVELGIQYRRRYEVYENKKKYSFEPYSFVSAMIGTNFPLHTYRVTPEIFASELGQHFAISYGRRYCRLAAVRGYLEASRYGLQKDEGTYPLTLGADFMLDVLSVVGGYNPERLINIFPFAGILYTHNEKAEENNFGMRAGADLECKINDEWSVIGEFAMKAYKGAITTSSRLYTKGEFSLVPHLSLGVAYKF